MMWLYLQKLYSRVGVYTGSVFLSNGRSQRLADNTGVFSAPLLWLNGGLLEAEPDCEKYLSEETAKLQRHFGGGDLCSFPQFTFTEPKMDP